jgi:uncharacterized membrane protein YedE/YeeE
VSSPQRTLPQAVAALLAGLIFGAGLVVSGMTKPSKVIGFLDLFGAWDASLMLVMGGAIGVHFFAYRFMRGRSAPLFAGKLAVPTRRDIDAKLVLGAAIFGAGWGLGGYCPGPALVSTAAGTVEVLVFVAALLAGTYGTAKLEAFMASSRGKRSAAVTPPAAAQLDNGRSLTSSAR